MSVDLYVTCLRDGDSPEHKNKVEAKRALDKVGIALPKELYDYFDGSDDEDCALEVSYKPKVWNGEYKSGYEINLSELPKEITKIRVYLA